MAFFKTKRPIKGKHVLITGGSKGIGLALAKEAVTRGASVTLVARNKGELSKARASLAAACRASGAKVHVADADTTSMSQLEAAVASAEAALGPVDVLVCNAGLSLPGLFAHSELADYQRQVDVNYLGTVKTIKSVLPGMLARQSGHICIISSALAICGFAGYSSYAPSKWALRGLADCLRNELVGSGVHISIGYPPDTDTPGYAAENVGKPPLCVAVNDALGSELFPAEKASGPSGYLALVAHSLLKGIEKGSYHLPTPDIGQMLLIDAMSGLSPKVFPLILSALLAPITNIVLALLRWRMDRVVAKSRSRPPAG